MSKIIFQRKNNNYREFSNYYISRFVYDGIMWDSVEAAFQAQKTLDMEERKKFASLTPGQARAKGRSVLLRPDWEQVKYDLMYKICLEKFKQNEYLKEKLLASGDALIVENTTSWHDHVWGCCLCYKCRNRKSRNNLGIVLMKIRSELAGENIPAKFTLGENEVEFDFDSDDYLEKCNTPAGIDVFNNIYRYAK